VEIVSQNILIVYKIFKYATIQKFGDSKIFFKTLIVLLSKDTLN